MAPSTAQRLDRTVILDAAQRLVAIEGPDALTMRKLGAELQSDPTAVYRHFRSKDEIVGALTERMFAEVSANYTASADWRTDLRWIMVAVYRVYVTNVALAASLASEPWENPTQQQGSELILDMLHRAGLRGAPLAMMHHVVITVIAGAGVYNAYEPKVSAADRARLQRSFGSLPEQSHPRITEVAGELFPDQERVFQALVDTIIIGIEIQTERSQHDYGSPTDEEVHLA